MKIYLKKNDVMEILARHFELETMITVPSGFTTGKEVSLVYDGLYWEGNKEKQANEDLPEEK